MYRLIALNVICMCNRSLKRDISILASVSFWPLLIIESVARVSPQELLVKQV